MDFRVYRQNALLWKDGTTVIHSGEDAQPYVDDHLIMVADGLGGTGAIRHQLVDSEIFNEETVVPMLFKGLYDLEADEALTAYVKASFAEMYPLKDVYQTNIHTVKKSSYFGSRIVSAALAYRLKHDSDLDPDAMLAKLAESEGEARAAYLKSLGERFTAILKADITKISENANLIYEAKIPKLKLLATTLCATVYREREDCVEALYLIIGDSRPYVWSLKDGLCQVIEDQERADGGMNGCVHVNGDFAIECRYFTFSKPCALMNASDGVFESGYFLSPMAFEKLLLEAVIGNDSIEAVERKLVSDYDTYGTHDDSSTLAMRCFGYGSFEEFRAVCRERMNIMQEKYFSKMSDLLEVDYINDYEQSGANLGAAIRPLKEELVADEGVKARCEAFVWEGNYPDGYAAAARIAQGYERQMGLIESAVQEETQIATESMLTLITDHFYEFLEAPCIKKRLCDWKLIDDVKKVKNKLQAVEREYEKMKEEQGIEHRVAETQLMLGRITDAIRAASCGSEGLEKCNEECARLLALAQELQLPNAIRQRYEAYVSENRKLASFYAEEIKTLCDSLLSGELEPGKRKRSDGLINRAVNEVLDIPERIHSIREDRTRQAMEGAVATILKGDITALFTTFVREGTIRDKKLLKTARKLLEEHEKKTAEMKQKAERQQALFDAYEQQYAKYM